MPYFLYPTEIHEYKSFTNSHCVKLHLVLCLETSKRITPWTHNKQYDSDIPSSYKKENQQFLLNFNNKIDYFFTRNISRLM